MYDYVTNDITNRYHFQRSNISEGQSVLHKRYDNMGTSLFITYRLNTEEK